jgi:hypothetical protein
VRLIESVAKCNWKRDVNLKIDGRRRERRTWDAVFVYIYILPVAAHGPSLKP